MGYNITLLIGIGLLIASIIIIRQRLVFINQSEKATGTVIDIRKGQRWHHLPASLQIQNN